MKEVDIKKVILGIVGALAALIAAQMLAQVLASLLFVIHIPVFVCNGAAGILYVVIAYFLLKIFSVKVLKFELAELAIPRFRIRVKWVVVGLVLPLAVTGIYLLFPGEFQKSGMSGMEVLTTVCAGVFFTGIAAGIVEEMVFRGFILNLIDKRWGRNIAIIVPSLLFGAVHIIGMDFSIVSCLQVLAAGTLVGIMFSFIALEQFSIWNSANVHAIWNIVILGGVIYIGKSVDEYSMFTYVLKTNSFAITGGDFGIESSIIAIAGYGVVCFIASKGFNKKAIS